MSQSYTVTERLRQFAAYGDTAEGRILAQLALTEIERLLPYVEAFRREETRADKLGQELDDLRGLAQCSREQVIEECAQAIENYNPLQQSQGE